VNVPGGVARVYNATASGARGLHYYYPNLFNGKDAFNNFVRTGDQFTQRDPITEIALYYPETFIKLNSPDILSYAQKLRERFDFNYISDEQITDAGLAHTKALVLMLGNIAEAASWRRITDWVRKGGVLIYPTGMGRLRTVERDETPHEELFGPNAKLGKGRVVVFDGAGDSTEYRDFICATLAAARELSADSRLMVSADGKDDGVFVTVAAPGKLLWLNYTNKPVIRNGIEIPAYSIR